MAADEPFEVRLSPRTGSHARSRRRRFGGGAASVAAVLALLIGGYSVVDRSPGSPDNQAINVLMVGNPQMLDIMKLTPEHFTERTGIQVNYTVLPENELRAEVTRDVSSRSGQYDVVTVGAYEVPIWADKGWLNELSTAAEEDTDFDKNDLLRPIVQSLSGSDGDMYGVPFYGESSVLMYREDLFEKAGLTMPERPTWAQIEGFAEKLHNRSSGMSGICLRGLPGWGEVFAPLTTVVNTFGGTWFTEDWKAEVDSPAFTAATEFYVDLIHKYGEPNASKSGYTQCLDSFSQGESAMWYDATAAAATLEDPKASKVAGKVGYAFAPVNKTEHSGWLWSWAWATPKTTKQAEEAWEFIRWASGKSYERVVGEELGWSRIPDGKRESTYYQILEFAKVASPYYQITLDSIVNADPENPGLQTRPAVGVQFVSIPEFAELGTRVSGYLAQAIEGDITVEQALAKGQKLAEAVAEKHRGKSGSAG